MNVLIIGPYRQTDEWGYKSRALIANLQSHGHKVCSRPLYLSNAPVYDGYSEACELTTLKDDEQYDVLIQFALQPFVVYDGNFKKNIAIFNSETIPNSLIETQLQHEILMDEVWVDSQKIQTSLQGALKSFGAKTDVRYVSPSLQISMYPDGPPISIGEDLLRDRFIFYYIGDPTDPKGGFRELYSAYIHSFCEQDQVALIVAPEQPINERAFRATTEECTNDIYNSGGSVRRMTQPPVMRLMEAAITGESRISLHRSGDCIVCPSYSIAANYAALEGAIYQSMPIINKSNGSYEILGEDNAWGIECYEEHCIGGSRSDMFNRFTANESWFKPTVMSIGKLMKEAYTNKFKREQKRASNKKLREFFAHDKTDPLQNKGGVHESDT